jgi:predicted nucleotidyltransferase component of viral defense system
MLRTDALEKSTLELLKKLQCIHFLKNTRLAGGTALALQLGHRLSVDLDFFGTITTNTEHILEELRNNNLEIRTDYSSTNIKQFTIENVKVDFVNYPYEWLEPLKEEKNIRLAGLSDIAAMKLEAITNRGTRRDFVDLYFLLKVYSLKQQMEFYLKKYPGGSSFNVLRSLTYFTDAETMPMPKMLIPINWDEVKSSIRQEVCLNL